MENNEHFGVADGLVPLGLDGVTRINEDGTATTYWFRKTLTGQVAKCACWMRTHAETAEADDKPITPDDLRMYANVLMEFIEEYSSV